MVITLALFSFVKTLYFSIGATSIKILKYNNNYYLFGNYQSNSFVIKLNSYKVVIWSKVLYDNNLTDAIIRNDTIFIFSNYPYFSTIKLDLNGNLISSSTFEIYNTGEYKVFSELFGSFYLTGSNYIIKVKNNGKIDWVKSYSNANFCIGTTNFYILCRHDMGLLVIMKIDANGNVIKSKAFGIYNTTTPIKMFRINDKFYIFASYVDISNKLYIFISSIDTSLSNIIWSKVLKPSDNSNIYLTSIDNFNNHFILVGSDKTLTDIFYLSIDTLGNIIFQRKSESASIEQSARLYKNSIFFYKQDSLALFDIDVNDGSSCYLDTSFNLVPYNISTFPFSDIQINVNDVNFNIVSYPITDNAFVPIENEYCEVSVNEKDSKFSQVLGIYDLDGRYLGCELKHLKKNEVYIISDGKRKRKILKF